MIASLWKVGAAVVAFLLWLALIALAFGVHV